MNNRIRTWARGLAALAAVPLAMSLTSAAAPATAEPLPAADVLRTEGAAVPQLDWRPCPDTPGYECSTADAPLSYRDPGGQTIQLALGRLPAIDQEHKLGSIFYNPGGPGGPGQIPPELTGPLHERFDIVGFDPRGIRSSTGLRCFDDPQEGFKLLNGDFPVTPRQERQLIADTAQGTDQCARNAGPLIDHMSTANAARDMDLLRQAVGDEKLSYYGISYGTHLGSVYANLFPDRVGALALDSALDPIEWTTGYQPEDAFHPFSHRIGSYDGAQQALRTFLGVCAADERCAFREPGTDLLAKYNTVLDRLLWNPVTISQPGGEPVEVTYQLAVDQTKSSLYSASASAGLAEFLQAVDDASDPSSPVSAVPVVALPAQVPKPGFQQAGYYGVEQGIGVMCADSSNPSNPWEWSGFAREADRDARGFGSTWTYMSLGCATWPGVDADRYTGPWNRKTANPILVLGNSLGDPATPYDDSEKVSKLLDDAHLLTLNTFGHGARGHSACVDSALDRYFIDGELPAEGTVCEPDQSPFDPPA